MAISTPISTPVKLRGADQTQLIVLPPIQPSPPLNLSPLPRLATMQIPFNSLPNPIFRLEAKLQLLKEENRVLKHRLAELGERNRILEQKVNEAGAKRQPFHQLPIPAGVPISLSLPSYQGQNYPAAAPPQFLLPPHSSQPLMPKAAPDIGSQLDLTVQLIELKKYDQALEYANAIILQDPTNAMALCHKAQCLLCLSRYEESLTICEKVLQTQPANEFALQSKIESLFLLKKNAECIETIRFMLDYHPYNRKAAGIMNKLSGQ